MKSVFTRMNPNPDNMVTEPGLNRNIAILCVECGWEGTASMFDAPWHVFLSHQCRLISESVSTMS